MQEFEVVLENVITVCRTVKVQAESAKKAADFALFLDQGDEHVWSIDHRNLSFMLNPVDLDRRSDVRKVTPAAG